MTVIGSMAILNVFLTILCIDTCVHFPAAGDAVGRSTRRRGHKSVSISTGFPFLDDPVSIEYLRKAKVLFIVRGLPGSGKTWLSDKFRTTYGTDMTSCSADDYFKRDGEYVFNPSKLGAAHKRCMDRIQKACQKGSHPVILVDNTNIRIEEMEFYIRVANEAKYVVVIFEPKTWWSFVPGELAVRNSHNVPRNTIRRRLKEWETITPYYFGWFLHDPDSRWINSVASKYLNVLSKDQRFWDNFSSFAPNAQRDLVQFFWNSSLNATGSILHCTANFCGTPDEPGNMSYAERQDVKDACGKAFKIEIVGFYVTPRTFGARVSLGNDALALWNQDDNEESSAVAEVTKAVAELNISGSVGAKTGCASYPKLSPNRLTNRKGSRAHLTLGCSGNWNPVQTGLDLVQLVRSEGSGSMPTISIPVQGGKVVSHGQGEWMIHLNKPLVVQVLFAGYYKV